MMENQKCIVTVSRIKTFRDSKSYYKGLVTVSHDENALWQLSRSENVSWQYVTSKCFVTVTLKTFLQVTLKIKSVRQNSRAGSSGAEIFRLSLLNKELVDFPMVFKNNHFSRSLL